MRRLLLITLVLLAACSTKDSGNPAPPKVEGKPELPEQTSTIVVPVTASLAELEAGINAQTPVQLWQINQHQDACVPGRKVAGVKVTPDLGCTIQGFVTRGTIRLSGSGDRLVITMPVKAQIAAKNVGGVVSKTGTGSATVVARGRLGIAGDWQPTAKIDIDYDWREPPGIDFLGKRITFIDKADDKLRPVLAKLERDLPKQLASLKLRQHLADVWPRAFTVVELSKDNPPAWMRIAPRRLGFGGYRIEGRQLNLLLAADALTQTFVGVKPDAPPPIPLPPPSKRVGTPGLRFFVPVLADYKELEPVVQRVLRKRAAKGITLTGIGPVDADFGEVTIYATTGNHLAVGVKAKVKARAASFAKASGEAWLTALPVNASGSQVLEARDVKFATRTDSKVVNLLVALFDDPSVQQSIAEGLRHDFAPDYQKVLAKAQKAIGSRREGDFVLSATIDKVVNGQVKATGAGLFLPVSADGSAHIDYRPR